MEGNNDVGLNEKIGTWKAFASIIVSPGTTFAKLLESPRTWLPSLYLGLVSLLLTLPLYGKYTEYANYVMTKNSAVQGAVSAQVTNAIVMSTLISIFAGVVLAPLIGSLITGALVKLLNLVMGEEAKFKQLWTVTVFSQVPAVVGLLIGNLLILLSAGGENIARTMSTGLSAAALVPIGSISPFLFGFLVKVNIFKVWGLILTSLGVAQAFRSRPVKVGAVIVLVWVVVNLVQAYLGQNAIKMLYYN